jgi:hypothetical protein
MGAEATADAIQDGLLRRYGWSDEQLRARQFGQAQGFPETYLLDDVVSAQCVDKFFGGVHAEFAKREAAR